MSPLSVEQAASRLPAIVQQLTAGEELLRELNGRVVAKITGMAPPSGPPYRKAGFGKGEFVVSDDFDEPLEDFAEYIEYM